jgi:predicted Zn-dependent protease
MPPVAAAPGTNVNADQRIETFRAFVARSPDDAFARYSLAMALRSAARLEEAVAEFEENVRRKPEYVPSYLMLGQVLEGLGRTGDAAAAYERGVAAAGRAGDGHAVAEIGAALEALRARGTR